jgi:hypothetical protein
MLETINLSNLSTLGNLRAITNLKKLRNLDISNAPSLEAFPKMHKQNSLK